MRKILFFTMAFCAIMVASCNCKEGKCNAQTDECDSVETVEVVEDTTVVDTLTVNTTDTLAVE